MTSLLRKKHRITRLSTQPTSSRSSVGRSRCHAQSFVLLGTTILVSAICGNAIAESSASGLRWGRPAAVPKRSAIVESTAIESTLAATSHNKLRPRIRCDAQVIAAAWDTDEASGVPMPSTDENRSIVVERNSPVYGAPSSNSSTYDPFDEDDRLAQLPNDPFDDPFDEPAADSTDASEFDDTPVEDLEDAEAAVEQEIERRRAAEDLIDDQDSLEDDMQQSLEVETPETYSNDVLDDMEAEDQLSDDPEDEELLQSEDDDWKTPDFDLAPPKDMELTPEELRQRSEEKQREREESEQNCREEIGKVNSDKISSIDLSIRVPGNAGEDFPYECSVSTSSHQPRQWPEITYNWKASALCHKPLYFEQVQLERYGHSWGPYVQPIMSGVHFFGSVPILPYKMGIRTPTECVYTLGYYRPGSCAPYMIDPVPFTWRAALFQTGAVTGTALAVP